MDAWSLWSKEQRLVRGSAKQLECVLVSSLV
jgi:hypothetical protein